MMRRIINALSPLAALAVIGFSLQSLVFTGTAPPPSEPLVPVTSVASRDVFPELASVSSILATTSTHTMGDTVPESVKRLLVSSGAVLLVSDPEASL
ncbi:MAG: hypothetical protein OEP52_10510 [Acidimicrobiia bacterium]|jgi:hypothetical protein|nr:hypothetical protein [Acidimicrobiia bacterium]